MSNSKNLTRLSNCSPSSLITPSGHVIESTHTAKLISRDIPQASRDVLLFEDKDLPHYNLLSVPQLTKGGLSAEFNKDGAIVKDKDGKAIITANMNEETGLYHVSKNSFGHIGVLFPKNSNTSEKVHFYIACFGSPTTSTFYNAVKMGWIECPGVKLSHIKDHPHSEATAKGHLDRTRSGLDSTAINSETASSSKTIHVGAFNCKSSIYADLTGRFPFTSNSGAEYILVMKCSDTNYIHVETLNSRSAKDYTNALERGIQFFKQFGMTHTHAKLDNETSGPISELLSKNGITPQFVAPYNHRSNPAERDIRTFKNHFIATLCTTDTTFPMQSWDLLVPQAELTLNLLRGSARSPLKSSWECLRGPYSFNRNPIAPPGTRVTVLDDPNARPTWAPHGSRGYYVGPAMQHYRSYVVVMESSGRTRITDSVCWHPKETLTTENIDRIAKDVVETVKENAARQLTKKNRRRENSERRRQKKDINRVPQVEASSSISSPTSGSSSSTPILPSPPTPPNASLTPTSPPPNPPPPHRVAVAPRHSSRTHQPNRKYCNLVNNNVQFGGLARSYKQAIKGEDAKLWYKAANEEFERLITTTNTMQLIEWNRKPTDRIASYYNPQIRIKMKDDGTKEYRVRGTYGGNISDYAGPKAARTAEMAAIKILLNAVASEGARFATADIKDFYLGTPMNRKEYMRIKLDQMPIESQMKFVKPGMIKDGHVVAEITKGIYGLAQAGKLAQERLFHLLNSNGYYAISPNCPCVFKHVTDEIMFCIVVDDFGIKYKDKETAEKLIRVLQQLYIMKVNWTGSSYVGFTIHQNPGTGVISLSMPHYIEDAVKRFNIDTSKNIMNPFDPSIQEEDETSPKLDGTGKKRVQQIIGVLLYYARAIDPTIIVRINKIASRISIATDATLRAAERVLAYLSSHPNSTCNFYRCDMRLICYSDSSYLTEKDSRSRTGGFMFLGDMGNDKMTNGPITCLSNITDIVASSAAEAEYAAAYTNAKEAVFIREILEAIGYKQPPTSIITDNQFVADLVNDDCKPKRSKAMDMRYHWLRDRVKQDQFEVKWCRREENISDFFTKDHTNTEFKRYRKILVPDVGVRTNVDSVNLNSINDNTNNDNGQASGCLVEEGVFMRTEKSPQDPLDQHNNSGILSFESQQTQSFV